MKFLMSIKFSQDPTLYINTETKGKLIHTKLKLSISNKMFLIFWWIATSNFLRPVLFHWSQLQN